MATKVYVQYTQACYELGIHRHHGCPLMLKPQLSLTTDRARYDQVHDATIGQSRQLMPLTQPDSSCVRGDSYLLHFMSNRTIP
jgi:hypothetical protein